MVAYNFDKKFAPLIESGIKSMTIRAPRNRHTRAGEPIQLYTGMRTSNCKKLLLPDPVCIKVSPIVIDETHIDIDGAIAFDISNIEQHLQARAFAQADGFEHLGDFIAYFKNNYALPFSGVIIYWAPSKQKDHLAHSDPMH